MTQASTITLDQVKAQLRITHDLDDALLARLIESAQQECLRFTGRSELPTLPYELPPVPLYDSGYWPALPDLPDEPDFIEEVPSSGDPVAPDVATGIILMVQADYEGDPAKRPDYRAAAEGLWMPYRIGLVV